MEKKSYGAQLDPFMLAENFGTARAELGKFLGMDGSAPANVTARVLVDQRYANLVVGLRNFPDWREKLLNDPLNNEYTPPAMDRADATDLPTAKAIIKKAATAAWDWAANGFEIEEPEEVQRRFEACEPCEKRAEAPKTLLYQAGKSLLGKDKTICTACGCFIATKIAKKTELCPLASDIDPNLSRWGGEIDKDPYKKKKPN